MTTPASTATGSPASTSRLPTVLIAAGYTAVKVAVCAGILIGAHANDHNLIAFGFAYFFNTNQVPDTSDYTKAANLAVSILLAGFALSFFSSSVASYFYLGAHVVNDLTFVVGLYNTAQQWYKDSLPS